MNPRNFLIALILVPTLLLGTALLAGCDLRTDQVALERERQNTITLQHEQTMERMRLQEELSQDKLVTTLLVLFTMIVITAMLAGAWLAYSRKQPPIPPMTFPYQIQPPQQPPQVNVYFITPPDTSRREMFQALSDTYTTHYDHLVDQP